MGDRATQTFTQVSNLSIECLATRGTELWACSDDRESGAFVAGVSTDEGATFTPKLHFGSVSAPVACGPAPAGAYACGANAGGSQCSGAPFAQLCVNLGCAIDAGTPAGLGAGGSLGASSGNGPACGCAAAGAAGANPRMLIAIAIAAGALRRRTGSLPENA